MFDDWDFSHTLMAPTYNEIMLENHRLREQNADTAAVALTIDTELMQALERISRLEAELKVLRGDT